MAAGCKTWILFPAEAKYFLLVSACRLALCPTHPHIQWVPEALFSVSKRLGREANHSPLSSAEVKKDWSYTFNIPHVFTASCLISTRGNLAFLTLQYIKMGHEWWWEVTNFGLALPCCDLD
jgi:hypothetical protein